jgi:N utilization substance protein B
LSKDYSTPKSNVFINGILDALVKDYNKKKLIIKEGRGLLE